jgi:nucleotide-binding universal stress UspA family protein
VFKKLIVGVDFSPVSDHAVEVAAGTVQGTDGVLVLVNVIPATARMSEPGGSRFKLRATIEQRLAKAAKHLAKEHHVKADYGVVDGRPAEEIARYAQLWGGDLIVIGSAGRRGLGRVLIGSVAERLVQVAMVPVLVVGPGSRPGVEGASAQD